MLTGFGDTPRNARAAASVSYTHLRAHETPEHLVCRLLLEKKKKIEKKKRVQQPISRNKRQRENYTKNEK